MHEIIIITIESSNNIELYVSLNLSITTKKVRRITKISNVRDCKQNTYGKYSRKPMNKVDVLRKKTMKRNAICI